MPLQATSGAASYDAFGGGVAVIPNYIEDVFSTYLYTGTSPTDQTINNGIDIAGKGGMVWFKGRNSANGSSAQVVVDTVRGRASTIKTYTTNAEAISPSSVDLVSFNSNGFTVGEPYQVSLNNSGLPTNYVSWTFRKQPKFFDVVTYTGTGSAQNISHSLGSVPGCIIVKRLQTTANWTVYHRGVNGGTNPEQYFVSLNTTSAQASSSTSWNNTAPTSTVFTVGTSAGVNASGETYVAYLYAHDSAGFGLTGTDNVISCGSFTTDSVGSASVTLGYEPQWVMVKATSTTGNWVVVDNMRGFCQTAAAALFPNTTAVEDSYGSANYPYTPTATGFTAKETFSASSTYIYIAIRRGPMKVPTDATTVFKPLALNNSTGTINTTNFPVDLQMFQGRTGDYTYVFDRLRGISSTSTASGVDLLTQTTGAESTDPGTLQWDNTSFKTSSYTGGFSTAFWNFRRAPSFFDEVCYTGTGSTLTLNHNLGVAPELVITKTRSTADDWFVFNTTSYGQLNATYAWATLATPRVFTSTTFTTLSNYSGVTAVAYLFATCAGVSKVGSYTGNGSTQTVDCGFGAGGARFVLIKRTDSTGDWYVYDTARGMTVLTDPYLLLNSTAAETATLGSVTTVSTGFAVNASILAAINTNAASYIFLAIA